MNPSPQRSRREFPRTRKPGTGLVLVLLAVAGGAWATQYRGGYDYDVAWTRGAFLTRGVGARAVGMGGAFTAVADDASAALWNPGGLGQLKSFSAVAQYDAAGLGYAESYVAVAAPVGSLVGAVSLQTMSYGTLQYRDSTGAKTGSESLLDGAVTQAWAFRNPAWLGGAGWTGVAVEVVQEAKDNALVGFNAGSLVPVSPRFTAGWALQHIGPSVGEYYLPQAFRLGTAYHGDRLNAAMDLSYGFVDHLMSVGVGGEMRVHPILALRLGYKWDGQDQGISGFHGISAGAGVRLGRFAVDYAYQPFGDLATSHRISIEYRMPSAAPVAPGGSKKKPPSVKVMPAMPEDAEEAPSLAPAGKPRATVPGKPAVATTRGKSAPRPSPADDWELTATPSGDAANPASLLPPPDELNTAPADGGGLLTPAGGAGPETATPESESVPSFGAPRRGERP